jgi:hypothetical protein
VFLLLVALILTVFTQLLLVLAGPQKQVAMAVVLLATVPFFQQLHQQAAGLEAGELHQLLVVMAGLEVGAVEVVTEQQPQALETRLHPHPHQIQMPRRVITAALVMLYQELLLMAVEVEELPFLVLMRNQRRLITQGLVGMEHHLLSQVLL